MIHPVSVSWHQRRGLVTRHSKIHVVDYNSLSRVQLEMVKLLTRGGISTKKARLDGIRLRCGVLFPYDTISESVAMIPFTFLTAQSVCRLCAHGLV